MMLNDVVVSVLPSNRMYCLYSSIVWIVAFNTSMKSWSINKIFPDYQLRYEDRQSYKWNLLYHLYTQPTKSRNWNNNVEAIHAKEIHHLRAEISIYPPFSNLFFELGFEKKKKTETEIVTNCEGDPRPLYLICLPNERHKWISTYVCNRVSK